MRRLVFNNNQRCPVSLTDICNGRLFESSATRGQQTYQVRVHNSYSKQIFRSLSASWKLNQIHCHTTKLQISSQFLVGQHFGIFANYPRRNTPKNSCTPLVILGELVSSTSCSRTVWFMLAMCYEKQNTVWLNLKYKIKNTQNTRYLLSVTVTHASPIPKLLTLPGEERPLLVIGR